MTESRLTEPQIVVSPAMARVRVLLIGAGAAVLVLGAVVLFALQSPMAILGVVAWLLGAIILHDAVLSPIVLGVSVLARRAGRRVSRVVLLIIQGAVIVGAILTLLVVPEIYAKTLGPAPTVLPFDYVLRLALMWLALIVVTAAVCVLYLRRARATAARG
ncbi:hypothetical protein [Subtercola endophyticus]|uniref:hypothetical protein n=1 Tax=Subtercola endophyticus TaxID=2895559 RepID=UPI001E2F31DC|nr:hypothetical protein [Subtercola endophyticus]UFS59717.1 hypothetical protein LQ955_02650 [Subtercola endophyticus]